MIENLKSEKVLVTKGFCSPYEAVTLHRVFTEDKDGNRDKFVGVAVKDGRGFVTYAQYEQMSAL